MALDKKKIEQRLCQAVREETPNLLPQILSARNMEKGTVIDMTQALQNQKKKHTVRNWAIAAAAALVLAVGGFAGYQYQFAVDTAVSIDVNPSIELEVNRQEKVLRATPLNDDAQTILDGMKLEGVNLKTAVNAVIGSMVQNGYFTDEVNSILLSVDNDDEAKRVALQEELTQGVNESLQQLSVNGTVFAQSLNSSAELKALAEQYGISEGKAYWVQMLTAADSTLSADVLAKLSINDLALLAEARNLKYDYVGTANDTAYIGLEKAKEIAIAKAGGGDVVSIELDVEDGVMVYEGEIVYNNVEYDFDINALDGTILKWEEDRNGVNIDTSNVIGEARAKEIILAKAPGAEITKLVLEEDDGILYYEGYARVDGKLYEFEVKADDGVIRKWELDDDSSNNNYTGNSSGNSGNNSNNNNNSTSTPKPTATPKPTTAPSTSISMDEARTLVLKKVPGATITKIELDYDDGRKIYEGEAYKDGYEYEFEINASTGKFIKWEQDWDDDHHDDDHHGSTSGLISAEKAEQAVLNKLPGATIRSMELDEDDGYYCYEGEAYKNGVEYEFVIDAYSGKILEWERDD